MCYTKINFLAHKIIFKFWYFQILSLLALSWQRPLSYRNQSIDLQSNDNGLRHERVKTLVFPDLAELLTLMGTSPFKALHIFLR